MLVHTLFISAALIFALATTQARAETLLERGNYLMKSIVACGNCHTPKVKGVPDDTREFAGALVADEKPLTAYAPNITMDKKTGIGNWTDEQIISAIREGKRPDGSLIGPPMPIHLYSKVSDSDVKALVAYMRTVKPVTNKMPKSVYRIPLPKSYGLKIVSVPDVPRTDRVKYGAYLAGPLGHCIECHTPMVKGHPDFKNQLGAGGFAFHGPWGVSVSANITPHPDGIKTYSDAQITAAIRTGTRPDGTKYLPPMAFAYYKNINDQDLSALIAYLRSLKPVPTP
jgi:cytochrome c553